MYNIKCLFYKYDNIKKLNIICYILKKKKKAYYA